MSLASNIQSAFTRVGTEFKTIRTMITGSGTGTLAALTTTDKTSLLAAVNEVNAKPTGAGGAAINDTTPSGTTTYSSTKINALNATQDTAISGKAATVHTHVSGDITNFAAAAVSAVILDTATTADTAHAWSAKKTNDTVASAVAGLVNSAPAALDTLAELSTALGGDANFATTTATALGNRLRVDAAQTLTGPQQAQGQANLGVYSTAQVGDPNTDFVATFVAALA